MAEPQVLVTGVALGESPRWHDGRLWFADWGAHRVLAVDESGATEVVLEVATLPLCIDWLPDGRLLCVAGSTCELLRKEPDGSVVVHADLSAVDPHGWNDIAVDPRGFAYVNCVGFDFPGGEFRPGLVAAVAPDGTARRVADGVAFPNGMVVVDDGRTLVVAESYASRLTAFTIGVDGGLTERRAWAELVDANPDGICVDAEGAIWYADVPHQRCVRVREGGEVLQTVDLDQGAFACALGGPEGRTLYATSADWPGAMTPGSAPTGRVLGVDVDVPAPGRG